MALGGGVRREGEGTIGGREGERRSDQQGGISGVREGKEEMSDKLVDGPICQLNCHFCADSVPSSISGGTGGNQIEGEDTAMLVLEPRGPKGSQGRP